MAVKYTIPFKDYDNVSWRIDIETSTYSGTAIEVRQAAKTVALSYNGETDDPYTVLIPSELSFSLLNQGQIDVKELQRAQDRSFVAKLYQESQVRWTGYLITDKVQRRLLSAPTQVDLSAVCGLTLLKDMPYSHADLNGGRCLINYFRQILFSTANLGLPLPIRWTNTLQCTAFVGEDVFSGSVRWAQDAQGLYSYNSDNPDGQIKTCGNILENLLKEFQCRIYQENGKWIIRRVNDFVAGSFVYSQVPANLGDLVVTGGTENVLKLIGRNGFKFQNKDALMTTKQGLKTARVEYVANVRENILPNGSQDYIVETPGSNDRPLYWWFYDDPFLGGSAIPSPPLDGREGGYSNLITNTIAGDPVIYTPVEDGGSFGNNGIPIDTNTLVRKISLGFTFSLISGFDVDGSGLVVWTSNPLQIKVVFKLGLNTFYLNAFGFWQLTETSIPISVPGLKLNEVARIDFDKFQGVLMPTDNVQPTPGYKSEISMGIEVKNNQRLYVDNIYIRIDQGNDVYESTYATSKNTTVDSRELQISSSYNGYMTSNLMTSWYNSDDEFEFSDGFFYVGALTGMTANAIMRFRYKPSEIFNGTISTRGNNWSFDQIYLIDTLGTEKYLPLNAKYNIETCDCFIVAMEARNDAIDLTETYYSSNDKPLSN